MGTYRGLGSLGFGLTAFLTGSVADRFSIRAPFALSALNLMVAFLLALRIKEPAPDGSPDRVTLRDGTALGRLWSLAAVSELPLMILSGWLSDRVGRLPMLCVGFLAWVVVFVGYVVAPMMPWIVLIQLVRGFAYSAFTATAMTYTAEARPRSQRGWVSGLYGSAGGIGSIIGASMGGTLAQLAGFRAMISTNAVLLFGGTVYLAVVAVRWRVGGRSSHQARL